MSAGELMTAKPRPPRELAARALCRHDGHAEDIKFEGKPMWESYLPAADAVLAAIGSKDAEPSALRVIAGPKAKRP